MELAEYELTYGPHPARSQFEAFRLLVEQAREGVPVQMAGSWLAKLMFRAGHMEKQDDASARRFLRKLEGKGWVRSLPTRGPKQAHRRYPRAPGRCSWWRDDGKLCPHPIERTARSVYCSFHEPLARETSEWKADMRALAKAHEEGRAVRTYS